MPLSWMRRRRSESSREGRHKMPNYNGMGPDGRGPGTGRGWGPCGAGGAWGPGCGRGYGRGRGMGYGRGMGWAAVGYGSSGVDSASANMRAALEERKAYLRAELARTEALLSDEPRPEPREGGDFGK